MTRQEEYQTLRIELENVPEALENTVERALARENACRRKRRAWSIPAGSLAACLALFLVLVNAFPTFAAACEGVPVLGRLAEALQFDRSLRRAVENDYVQHLDLSETQNGITARVEYLIVDQKNVNLFFRLRAEDGRPLQAGYQLDAPGCVSLLTGVGLQAGDTLRQLSVMAEDQLPDTLELTLRAYRESSGGGERGEPAAEFHFTVTYDPTFTAQGETIPAGTDFTLDGQTLTLDRAEVYPTHMRLILREAAENTAALRALDFCLTDDRGNTYDAGAGSILSMGSGEGERCYLLESPWFLEGKGFTLHIRGAQFLTKGREWVRFDLREGTAQGLPEGVSLEGVQHYGDTWRISFRTDGLPVGGTLHGSLFGSGYRSEDGALQGYVGRGLGGDGTEYVTLEGYPGDVVYLSLSYDRSVLLSQPLDLPLN